MKSIVELRNLKLRLALETVKKDIIDIVGDNVRLIVYGSYARGEEREDSDVDLMVVLSDEKKTFEIEDRVRDVIYDAGFSSMSSICLPRQFSLRRDNSEQISLLI